MKTIFVTLFALASFSVIASEDLPKAPQKIIEEAIEICEQYSKEDEVSETELANYLLECVNDELSEQGYQKLESLD